MGNRSLLPGEKVKREGKKPSEKSAGWSLLGFASFGILACAVAYSIINYSNLSSGEGWGMVQMAGFVALGLAGLFHSKPNQEQAGCKLVRLGLIFSVRLVVDFSGVQIARVARIIAIQLSGS